ncbi:ATP-binding protein [Kiritimatiellota bacterium B12222]|nr:ATP-binding protein [Kiritimatiellota bacterium B12222]
MLGFFLVAAGARPFNGDPLTIHQWVQATVCLFLLWILNAYRHRIKQHAVHPQNELLQEIQDFKNDQSDRKIHLPLNSPFKSVAELINQLTSVQEKQARQLTEQHHHQQVLLNNMSEGIVALDNDQRITGINPTAARWLNLGNSMRVQGEVFYTRCRNPQLLQLIEELTSSQATFKETFLRLERAGMGDRVVKVKGSPLIDRDQTLGVLLILQDVTTLQRLETLRQDFVANVSHELRTPLTAIKGYTELMADDPSDTTQIALFTDRILKQSSRMINIIDDLLSLTRIESTEKQTALSLTELHPLLERVIHLCEEHAEARHITVTLHCPDSLRAELYPPLFEQAIHNLLSNAIKYTHSGTEISLKASQADAKIRIDVSDQGPGIPPSDQARIFERFYRVDKARSRAVGGTGLGLSIVKHIVHLHQGKVGLNSAPGQGCTFWISLPAPAKEDD